MCILLVAILLRKDMLTDTVRPEVVLDIERTQTSSRGPVYSAKIGRGVRLCMHFCAEQLHVHYIIPKWY